MDPEECYRVSKQTLELMDQFAGPVYNRKKNLPSILQFPEPLNIQTIQPNVLKSAPASTKSQISMHRTELDDDPKMPHYNMELQYMDFSQTNASHDDNKSRPNWTFDGLTGEEVTDDSDDSDWGTLARRAQLDKMVNIPQKKQTSNEIRVDENYFIRTDKEQLRQLKDKFGFKFSPIVEYLLPRENPLFNDAV